MLRARFAAAITAAVLTLAGSLVTTGAQAQPLGKPTIDARVMTYNIRYDNGSSSHAWADRLPLMTEQIQTIHPDVLGVQEALQHQMEDLSAALPGYDWVGQGRDGGESGEYMGLFFDTERLLLKKSGDFWLSDTPSVPGSTSWGNTIPRMVTWALLQERRTGKKFYVYNTHFDCDATCGNSQGDYTRLRSAQLIADRMERLPHPALLTGDFNETAGSSGSYDHLLSAGFGDTWEESERRGPIVGTYNNYGPPVLGGARIDWILRHGQVRTVRATIDTFGVESGHYPSDHLPTFVDVRIGGAPTGPIPDTTAPEPLQDVTAVAANDANAISLDWAAGSDQVGVESYNVYASTDPDAKPGPDTLLANTPRLTYLHRNLALDQTWHYRVAAVDRQGNVGPPSPVVSATTDAHKIMFEAEDGVPLLPGSAEARSQANCCGLDWSSDHQLLVLSSAAGDTASFNVTMPTSGTFDLTVDATMADDFATWTVAVDGVVVGEPFDAYAPEIQLKKGIDLGPVDLTEGQHTVTFTAVDHNAASGNYRMGIDALRLDLVD